MIISITGTTSFYRWFFYYSPYTRVFEFILGCLTAQLYMRVAESRPSAREAALARYGLVTALLVLLVYGLIYSFEPFGPAIAQYVVLLKLSLRIGYSHRRSDLCSKPLSRLDCCSDAFLRQLWWRSATLVSRFMLFIPGRCEFLSGRRRVIKPIWEWRQFSEFSWRWR